MYPNLRAEQVRHGLKNQDVADSLKISRESYERKKKSGRFTAEESRALCGLFKCGFSYLFATEDSKGDDM